LTNAIAASNGKQEYNTTGRLLSSLDSCRDGQIYSARIKAIDYRKEKVNLLIEKSPFFCTGLVVHAVSVLLRYLRSHQLRRLRDLGT
jgi:hypothetical protein